MIGGLEPNLTSVTSVTLKIKLMTPKRRVFLRDLRESHIPSINMIAINHFELSRGNECLQTDGQMVRQTESAIIHKTQYMGV